MSCPNCDTILNTGAETADKEDPLWKRYLPYILAAILGIAVLYVVLKRKRRAAG